MKPAREPAPSRPKPCASFKNPHESCPFAAPWGPRWKKNDSGQTSAFPSETSRFAPLILAHRGSALPWLVDDRAALRLRRIWCVPTRWRTTRLSAIVLPASRVPPPSRRAPNWSSEEAHNWEHHPQPTIPPPSLNRQAESRRQPVGCISRGRARPYTRRKDPPTLIPRNQVSEGESTIQYPKPCTKHVEHVQFGIFRFFLVINRRLTLPIFSRHATAGGCYSTTFPHHSEYKARKSEGIAPRGMRTIQETPNSKARARHVRERRWGIDSWDAAWHKVFNTLGVGAGSSSFVFWRRRRTSQSMMTILLLLLRRYLLLDKRLMMMLRTPVSGIQRIIIVAGIPARYSRCGGRQRRCLLSKSLRFFTLSPILSVSHVHCCDVTYTEYVPIMMIQ